MDLATCQHFLSTDTMILAASFDISSTLYIYLASKVSNLSTDQLFLATLFLLLKTISQHQHVLAVFLYLSTRGPPDHTAF